MKMGGLKSDTEWGGGAPCQSVLENIYVYMFINTHICPRIETCLSSTTKYYLSKKFAGTNPVEVPDCDFNHSVREVLGFHRLVHECLIPAGFFGILYGSCSSFTFLTEKLINTA